MMILCRNALIKTLRVESGTVGFDNLKKAWRLRELVHTYNANRDHAAHRFWRVYGCSEGKGNAAEKAIKEWSKVNPLGPWN